MGEFKIGSHGIFDYEDRALFIQQKIDNLMTIAKLLDYEIQIKYDEDNYEIILSIIREFPSYIHLYFVLKPYSNRFDNLYMSYLGSNKEHKMIYPSQRSVKYMLRKAEYLI